jgi:hypothetical protein
MVNYRKRSICVVGFEKVHIEVEVKFESPKRVRGLSDFAKCTSVDF